MPFDPADPAIINAIRPLRALAACAAEDWFQIVGHDPKPNPGRHLLRWPAFDRVIYTTEAYAYARGVADVVGHPEVVTAATGPDMDMPVLLSVDEAAAEARFANPQDLSRTSPLTRDGMISRAQRGVLEVLYLPRRTRSFFAAEIAALRFDAPADGSAMRRWVQIRDSLGLTHRMRIDATHLPPPGKPLALPLGEPETIRRLRALMLTHQAGWLEYRAPDDRAEGLVFHIDSISGRAVELAGEDVLPWLLGVADARGPGAADLITYREGLG